MFTKRILSTIDDPELKKVVHLKESNEDAGCLSWILNGVKVLSAPAVKPESTYLDEKSQYVQQSDLLRKFYMSIVIYGLKFTLDHASEMFTPDDLPPGLSPGAAKGHSANADKKVIIVGAGMSGIVAAYELQRAGYSVEILEMSDRAGGRVKTLGEKEGFAKGLHTDAGAMRLPLTVKQVKDKDAKKYIHFLTDYYALNVFGLKAAPFFNQDEHAYYNFYGESTKISDWKDPKFRKDKCDLYWPGWDPSIEGIYGIDDYYNDTKNVVTSFLIKRLKTCAPGDIKAQADQWDKWTKNWCQFSIESFLRSPVAALMTQLTPDDIITEKDIARLNKYLPWPEPAISGYSVFTYTMGLDMNLVAGIQEVMAGWWAPEMHSYGGGLSELPKAFLKGNAAKGMKGVEDCITYNRTVTKVEYKWSKGGKSVTVSGIDTSDPNKKFSVTGNSVIITVPLRVLRLIDIVNGSAGECGAKSIFVTKSFPREFQRAIQDISYSPATKIMLQYKKRFWNDNEITGG